MAISADLAPYVPLSFREGGKADGALLSTISEADATRVAQGIMARVKDLPPAAAQLFMAMADNASLAPSGQVPENIEAALDTLEDAVKLVSSLSVSGADIDLLARALLEQSAMQRHEALEQRLNAREIARAELLGQAGEMEQQAKTMMAGAIASVVLSVVSAAVSVAGGFLSLASGAKGLSQAKESLEGVKLQDEFKATAKAAKSAGDMSAAGFFKEIANQAKHQAQDLGGKSGDMYKTSDAIQAITSGVSGGLGSLGGMSKGLADADSKRSEAVGARAAADAQIASAVGDTAKEVQGALDDMVKAIIAFLKEIQESRSQQMQAFTRV